MTKGLVTVFGGSGFIGKYVVRALVKDGWRVRIPMRRPHTGQDLRVIGNVGQIQLVQANIRYPLSVDRAVEGSDAVINLVAVLFNQGKQNFESLHVKGAENVAKACAKAGIKNYVQMSSLGADAQSVSEYSRSRAEGEGAARAALPSTDVMRPSIVFGPEDEFFNRFAGMTTYSPSLPLIGGGHTHVQPVYAGDVARAIASAINQGTSGKTYELGGPQVYSMKELMAFTLKSVDRYRLLLPLPWFVSQFMGSIGEAIGYLPYIKPFLTRDQVNSLREDNVVSDPALTFQDLGIKELETVEAIVPVYLRRFRRYGQFHEKRTQA